MRVPLIASIIGLMLLTLHTTQASFIPVETIIVGDEDGFGVGIHQTADVGAFATPGTDNRSTAEALATNGAQFTDVFSALYPGLGPNRESVGSFIFPVNTPIDGFEFLVHMAGFEASVFGPFTVDFNGFPLTWEVQAGPTASTVRAGFFSFEPLIASVNNSGSLIVTFSRGSSTDLVGFDYLQVRTFDFVLTPEPSTFVLIATVLPIVLFRCLFFRRG
jgi:hypothetical protein